MPPQGRLPGRRSRALSGSARACAIEARRNRLSLNELLQVKLKPKALQFRLPPAQPPAAARSAWAQLGYLPMNPWHPTCYVNAPPQIIAAAPKCWQPANSWKTKESEIHGPDTLPQRNP